MLHSCSGSHWQSECAYFKHFCVLEVGCLSCKSSEANSLVKLFIWSAFTFPIIVYSKLPGLFHFEIFLCFCLLFAFVKSLWSWLLFPSSNASASIYMSRFISLLSLPASSINHTLRVKYCWCDRILLVISLPESQALVWNRTFNCTIFCCSINALSALFCLLLCANKCAVGRQ